MAIRIYKSITPGTRNRSVADFSYLTKKKPERSLLTKKKSNAGRNNRGVITIRHRGGWNPNIRLVVTKPPDLVVFAYFTSFSLLVRSVVSLPIMSYMHSNFPS